MLKNRIYLFITLYFVLLGLNSSAQILFDIGDYRNLSYISTGYNSAFENITIGIARRDYVKLIKREVIGVLDISLPITNHFFTRHAIRKGFQMNLCNKGNFKIPFIFASSSIVRENHFYKFHDITAEFTIAPGIYTKKYSLGFDIRYELIIFRLTKYTNAYLQEINPDARRHWENPYYSIAKVGVMAGINLKHFVLYIKSGYERNPIITKNYFPGYILFGFGYKFGTKPLK